MTKFWLLSCAGLFLMSACLSAAEVSDLNLEAYLVTTGDLPGGLQPAQVRKTIPDIFANLPQSDYQIYQQFTDGENSSGGVTVLVYADQADAEKTYKALAERVIEGQESFGAIEGVYSTREGIDIDGPWIKGMATSVEWTALLLDTTYEETEATYLQCNAVVYINFYNIPSGNIESIQAYATRLADRLDPMVCQQFSQYN